MTGTTFPTTADTVASLRASGETYNSEDEMTNNIAAAVVALEAYALTGKGISGVGNGYRVARGVNVQVAASDTVVTGLTTVVAVVVSWRDAPTVKQMFVNASIGNQAGAPAAGSILIRTYKPTAVNDVTPIAATDFSENLATNWIAIGT